MDCYGQGYCMANQTCQCFSGFSGKDCNEGLPKDDDTFVTDYDIRKEKNSEEDGSDDKKDEEDGSDDKKDDDDGSDDKKDDNDESDDKKDEEDKPVDPKVTGLEKKLAKLERIYDRLSLNKKKVDFRKEILELCLKESPKPKHCVRGLDKHVKIQKNLEVKITGFSDKINKTTEEINSLLTDDQKKARDQKVAENALQRESNLQQLMIEYLQDY